MYGIHPKNIVQLKAAVAAFGSVWFHGDGNMFLKKSDSDFRQEFSNPDSENSKVRANFTSGDHIPDTPEELGKILMAASQREAAIKKQKDKAGNGITVLKVPGAETPTRSAGAPVEDGPTAEQLQRTHADLQIKSSTLAQRETEFTSQAEQVKQQLIDKANQLGSKETEINQRLADLEAREAALKAKETSNTETDGVASKATAGAKNK